jgi:hypothetical protein
MALTAVDRDLSLRALHSPQSELPGVEKAPAKWIP